jgi:hypothetical protein
MQLFYFDIGVMSVYAGREGRADWGIKTGDWNAELWAGKSYLCASFDERLVRRWERKLAIALLAFGIGWMMEPPHLFATDNVEAVRMETVVTHQTGELLDI